MNISSTSTASSTSPRRKRNNFETFQVKKVEDTIRLKIFPALERLGNRRGRQPIKKITHLAAELHSMTGVHRTTLLRNHRYLSLLVDFLERKPGAIATLEGDGLSPDLLLAKLRAAQGEIANLRHSIRVLTARIEALSSDRAIEVSGRTDAQTTSSQYSDLNANLPFQDTAHLALILIGHINRAMNLPGGLQRIVVDLERKQIRDNSLRPGTQQIAGSERGQWFFEWANANRKFLFGS